MSFEKPSEKPAASSEKRYSESICIEPFIFRVPKATKERGAVA